MSVLIKGMDIPTCCADCDLHNPFSKAPYCRRLLRVIPLEGRLENCPLVKVPTPHGRLIDADIVLSQYNGSILTAQCDYAEGLRDAVEDIKNAPTIIEAEEGDE